MPCHHFHENLRDYNQEKQNNQELLIQYFHRISRLLWWKKTKFVSWKYVIDKIIYHFYVIFLKVYNGHNSRARVRSLVKWKPNFTKFIRFGRLLNRIKLSEYLILVSVKLRNFHFFKQRFIILSVSIKETPPPIRLSLHLNVLVLAQIAPIRPSSRKKAKLKRKTRSYQFKIHSGQTNLSFRIRRISARNPIYSFSFRDCARAYKVAIIKVLKRRRGTLFLIKLSGYFPKGIKFVCSPVRSVGVKLKLSRRIRLRINLKRNFFECIF